MADKDQRIIYIVPTPDAPGGGALLYPLEPEEKKTDEQTAAPDAAEAQDHSGDQPHATS
jgi:hypothetical protein